MGGGAFGALAFGQYAADSSEPRSSVLLNGGYVVRTLLVGGVPNPARIHGGANQSSERLGGGYRQ